MPLCLSKVEQVATEDLVELSEIEKHNLGKVMLMTVKFVGILFRSVLCLCNNNMYHAYGEFKSIL